jgi:hypothetical protein
MNIASFACGFAAGAFLTALLALLVCLIGAAVAWRYARAIEKAGLDVHLKPDESIQHP